MQAEGLLNRMMRRYATKPTKWVCVICNAQITSVDSGRKHFEGTTHQKKLKNVC